MLRKSRLRALQAILLVVGVFSGLLLAAGGAQALEVKKYYYQNYFYSYETCQSRGNQLMDSQPDWISFTCYRDPGDPKWSMDAFVSDGFGCSLPADSLAPTGTRQHSTGSSTLVGGSPAVC